MLRKALAILITLTVAWLSGAVVPASAEPVELRIQVLLSGESRLYYDAVDGLEEALNEKGIRYQLVINSDLDVAETSNSDKKVDYVIAVGSKAAQSLIDSPPGVPALSILVPRQAYSTLMSNTGKQASGHDKLSVVYLDQPASRLMALTKVVAARRGNKVGVLFGPTSEQLRNKYIEASEAQSLNLMHDMQENEKAALDAIEKLVKQSDSYLAVYDKKALNRKTAKWLLYLANVHQKPVIAYSKSYVDAGALAAIYTSSFEAGKISARWLMENMRSNNQSRWQRYPDEFTVKINRKIARKLDIELGDPGKIAEQIRKIEVDND